MGDAGVTRTTMPQSRTYTINEAASLSGRHPNTIRQKIKGGQIPATVSQGKFGDEYRIAHEDLVAAGLLPADGPLGESGTAEHQGHHPAAEHQVAAVGQRGDVGRDEGEEQGGHRPGQEARDPAAEEGRPDGRGHLRSAWPPP